MARISFITSVVLVSGLLTGCLESGSGTAQYNPYKDRPNIKPPIQTPEYDDTVADANALITGMHSRSELQVRNWIGFKLQGFNPTGFDVVSADDYIDVANLANQITTANAAQIKSAYATDSNMLWAAMAVLNRSLAASCFDATSGANTAECLVNWRNNNTAVFDTSRTELADNAIVLTVDNATLTATNDYKMKFTLDGDGEIIGILGPNGAGKTTFLRIIAGILEPTSGTVTFDELNYHDNETEIKKNIAYLSGNTKIYNTLSCYELLHMCADIYGVEKKDAEARILEISKTLDMDTFLYNRIGSLSTGQTQRVNIARCLIHNPKYYILDEATSGLDIISSQIILNFIKNEKKKGKTILYSTHYMEEAENICDKVIMINKGVIIDEGTPAKIKKDTQTTNLRDAFFKLIEGDNHEE